MEILLNLGKITFNLVAKPSLTQLHVTFLMSFSIMGTDCHQVIKWLNVIPNLFIRYYGLTTIYQSVNIDMNESL